MLQIDTVDSMNGTPADCAARAACTSARCASMPASPTGASTIGSASRWPSTSTAGSRTLTSFITTCRSNRLCRSDTFERIVASS